LTDITIMTENKETRSISYHGSGNISGPAHAWNIGKIFLLLVFYL